MDMDELFQEAQAVRDKLLEEKEGDVSKTLDAICAYYIATCRDVFNACSELCEILADPDGTSRAGWDMWVRSSLEQRSSMPHHREAVAMLKLQVLGEMVIQQDVLKRVFEAMQYVVSPL